MSGLETAIKNALDRSDRADGDSRARIYQSARRALDAGLKKQGVTDRLIIMQQHELLERRIHEIEQEELRRLAEPTAPPVEDDPLAELYAVSQGAIGTAPASRAASGPEVELGGETRSAASGSAPRSPRSKDVPEVGIDPTVGPAQSVAPAGADNEVSADTDRIGAGPVSAAKPKKRARGWGRGKATRPPKHHKQAIKAGRTLAAAGLDVPAERAAKPRKRRGILSYLVTWTVTLAVVCAGGWWFYQSGMAQSFIEESINVANRSLSGGSGQRQAAFDPGEGFSDDWVEVFTPAKLVQMKPGSRASVEAVTVSEGRAARIASATADENGNVTIDVPTDLLQQMAGRASTVALTLQSGADSSVQLSVRCDFGGLGDCNRRRFTATQEKQDALFRVDLDGNAAVSRPGRLILNSGIDGTGRPVLLYSVRILPGQ